MDGNVQARFDFQSWSYGVGPPNAVFSVFNIRRQKPVLFCQPQSEKRPTSQLVASGSNRKYYWARVQGTLRKIDTAMCSTARVCPSQEARASSEPITSLTCARTFRCRNGPNSPSRFHLPCGRGCNSRSERLSRTCTG